MARTVPAPYTPSPVPFDADALPRYLAAELKKISQAFRAQPVAFTINETSIVVVDTTENWQRLYDLIEANWDIPGGSWDPEQAEWTCPQAGLYQIIADTRVQPFGAGNKFYYAGLALLVLQPDLTLVRYETTDGGDDSVPLGVTMAFQLPFLEGARVYFEATVVHDQFVGSVTTESSAQLLRVSA